MKKLVLLIASHILVLVVGIAIGIYVLPILTAPASPPMAELQAQAKSAAYTGLFKRDLKDSDLLHWGEGTVSIGPRTISLIGRLAPGPDYKLYLANEFVETKKDFLRIKADAVRVGDVKTFENFMVSVPANVDVSKYSTVIVWCETFSKFITAAKYR